jgi:hypothetical protein
VLKNCAPAVPLALLAALALAPGCGFTPRAPGTAGAFAGQEPDYILAVVIDLSGSFRDKLTGDGEPAWRFLLRLTDRFRNEQAGAGSRCRVVISQISGRDRAVLWEGSPDALRKRFNANSFRDFLLARSDASSSRVHDSIADTVDRIAAEPAVARGKARSVVVVLSDLIDNWPDGEASRRRMLASLSAYGRVGGSAGFYWVDDALTAGWQRDLAGCGLRDWVVVSDVRADPPLPNFD